MRGGWNLESPDPPTPIRTAPCCRRGIRNLLNRILHVTKRHGPLTQLAPLSIRNRSMVCVHPIPDGQLRVRWAVWKLQTLLDPCDQPREQIPQRLPLCRSSSSLTRPIHPAKAVRPAWAVGTEDVQRRVVAQTAVTGHAPDKVIATSP